MTGTVLGGPAGLCFFSALLQHQQLVAVLVACRIYGSFTRQHFRSGTGR